MIDENDKRYIEIIKALNDGIWEWNIKAGKAFFSPAYYSMLGYENNEFAANYDNWKALVHAEDMDRVEKILAGCVKSGEKFDIELRMKMKSGSWLWVATRGSVIEKDSKGNTLRMAGSLTDVTKRKTFEKSLADKYEEIKKISDAMIGREVRIDELKRENEKLRAQIENK